MEPYRIEIVVFDGFDEIDAFGPFEVLSSAGFDVEFVAAENPGKIVSMRGITLQIQTVLGRPGGVVVPGGGWLNRAPEGTWAQEQRRTLPDKLSTPRRRRLRPRRPGPNGSGPGPGRSLRLRTRRR